MCSINAAFLPARVIPFVRAHHRRLAITARMVGCSLQDGDLIKKGYGLRSGRGLAPDGTSKLHLNVGFEPDRGRGGRVREEHQAAMVQCGDDDVGWTRDSTTTNIARRVTSRVHDGERTADDDGMPPGNDCCRRVTVAPTTSINSLIRPYNMSTRDERQRSLQKRCANCWAPWCRTLSA